MKSLVLRNNFWCMDIAILLNLVLGGLILGMQALLCIIWYDFKICFVLVSYCIALIGF